MMQNANYVLKYGLFIKKVSTTTLMNQGLNSQHRLNFSITYIHVCPYVYMPRIMML